MRRQVVVLVVGGEPADRLAGGLVGRPARGVAEARDRLRDRADLAAVQVLPARPRVLRAGRRLEVRPRHRAQPRLVAPPPVRRLGEPAHGQRPRADGVERLAHRGLGPVERELEDLGDVVRVHVVHGRRTVLRHEQLLAGGDRGPDARVDVADRVDDPPAGAADVPRVHDGARQPARGRLGQQQLLDRLLAHAVLAERVLGVVLAHRQADAQPVRPDRAAVRQQADVVAQTLDQLGGRRRREAHEVDDRLGTLGEHLCRRRPLRVAGLAVQHHPAHVRPGRVVDVRVARPPARRHDLVARPDEARDEVRTDVPGRSEDVDAHRVTVRGVRPSPAGGRETRAPRNHPHERPHLPTTQQLAALVLPPDPSTLGARVSRPPASPHTPRLESRCAAPACLAPRLRTPFGCFEARA